MKPSITIDERGVLLHVVNEAGEGFAIPLEISTVLELAAGLARARAVLKTTDGQLTVARAIGQLFMDLSTTQTKKESDENERSGPDARRNTDR